jgi:recombination protein RecA
MVKRKKRKVLRQRKNNKFGIKQSLAHIRKLYGKDSIFIYGEGLKIDVEAISTGSIILDKATGIGGVPKGRVTEIFGPESSGKTTLALHTIAEAQKLNGKCCFIDIEHALDMNYAENLGVDTNSLILSQPDYGEQALDIAEKMIESKQIAVVVVDSVAALVPKSELDGEMSDATVAVQARLMSKALRKLSAKVSKTKTALIFINQIRKKIGVMFGNPETTTGGEALKFYSTIRFDIRRIGSGELEGERISNKTRVKIVKNKVGAPFKTAEFEIRYGLGIDRYLEIIDLGIETGIIEQSGGWLTIKTSKRELKYNGKEKLRSAMVNKEKLFNYLRYKLTGIK